jgi:hypothetical protein
MIPRNSQNNKEIKFEQPSELLLLANRFIMLLAALIVLIVLFGGYWFLLKPKIAAIKVAGQETTAGQEDKLLNDKLIARIKELQAKYQEIKDDRQNDLSSLTKIVPSDMQIAELFILADQLAKKHGFQLRSIDIVTEAEASGGTGVPNPDLTTEGASQPLLSTGAIAAQQPEGAQIITEETQQPLDDLLTSQGREKYLSKRTDLKALTIHLVLLLSGNTNEKPFVVEETKNNKTSYEIFKGYLKDLENSLRLMDIQAVTFASLADGSATAGQESGQGGEKTFTIDLKTYYKSK